MASLTGASAWTRPHLSTLFIQSWTHWNSNPLKHKSTETQIHWHTNSLRHKSMWVVKTSDRCTPVPQDPIVGWSKTSSKTFFEDREKVSTSAYEDLGLVWNPGLLHFLPNLMNCWCFECEHYKKHIWIIQKLWLW